MPQPLKDPAVRQRRNKVPSAASLPLSSGLKAPALPKKQGGWDVRATEFWADVWASPMAVKYLRADVHGLFVLVDLVDRYWKGDGDLAAEIRQHRVCYGLTPLDRNRLQWKVEQGEAPKVPTKKAKRDFDPSKVLEMMPRKKA